MLASMLLGLGSTAAAQPAPPPANAPAASAAVTSYPPSAFAAVRPNTALDMINNLPGFTLDTGDAVRGFGGAAG
ncbi:MAG TPA: TonB-dependent receptor, partial [Caulobacteraceae bacterium]